METASPTLSCPTGTDTLWDCKWCKPVSRNVLVPLLPSPVSSCCRCGESQQRWKHWLWLAGRSWASSPAGSCGCTQAFTGVCLRAGLSSHWARFKKPKHRNKSAETRQLQKKLQTGGHRAEWFRICSGRVSKPRSAWLSCNTSAQVLAPPEQRASGASSAVLSHPWFSSNSHDKQSFTFANGGDLSAPRICGFRFYSFYHSRKTS